MRYGILFSYQHEFNVKVYCIDDDGMSRASYVLTRDGTSWRYYEPANAREKYRWYIVDNLDLAKAEAIQQASSSFKYCTNDLTSLYPELFI